MFQRFMTTTTLSRTLSLSSTNSSLSPPSTSTAGGASSWAASSMRRGTSTVIFVPTSTVLSTAMVPPIMSTMLFTMDMPRPVPWMKLMVSLRSRSNTSKMWSTNSGLMPTPLSSTSKRSWAKPARWLSHSVMVTFTEPPSGVYFTALLVRLSSTWLRRRVSPIRASWAMSKMDTSKRRCFARICG